MSCARRLLVGALMVGALVLAACVADGAVSPSDDTVLEPDDVQVEAEADQEPLDPTDVAPDDAGETDDEAERETEPDPDPVEVAGAEPCANAPRAAYPDVADDAEHAAAIDCLVGIEALQGPGYEAFGADDPIEGREVAEILARIAAVFDVPDDDVLADQPTDVAEVRRGQLAALLAGTYTAITGSTPEPRTNALDDIDGHEQQEAIETALALGLMVAATSTSFEPDVEVARGEAAYAAARLLVRLVQDDQEPAPGTVGAGFATRVHELPSGLAVDARRWTWEPRCPVHLDDLRLLEVVIVDLEGRDRWGQLVVHVDAVDELVPAFEELYDQDFRIARMEPIERYEGDDDASMAANNSSAFNCRTLTGSDRWSEHAYGWAVDLNPVQNPYVGARTVLPEAGREYLDRSDVRPGMLVRPGPVEAFDQVSWDWGGDRSSRKNYQHVSRTGG